MNLRFVASLMIALTVFGCSKAVDIPRDNIDEAMYREPGSYRIRLKGREEYLAKRFSVTDSTIVIEELMTSDERYRLERASMPREIPIVEVESVAEMRLNKGVTYGSILGLGLVMGLIIWLTTVEIGY